MSHLVFLGYLAFEHIKFKVNQDIMIKNFSRMKTKDAIFQISWTGFNSS